MKIYILEGEEQKGPFTAEELRQQIQRGERSPESLAWQEGAAEWQPLHVLAPDITSLPPQPPELQTAVNPPPLPRPPVVTLERAWYDSGLVIFPAALCCFPIGLLPLWMTKRFGTNTKIGLSIASGAGMALGFILLVMLLASTQNGDKRVPYFRAKELLPKEKRAAQFAVERDKLLKDAEDKLKAGDTLGAIQVLAAYADVLPDKPSQDLYERIRNARHEEASALLKKADDNGRSNDPQLVSLLEELDFLVSPSLWYRDRLDKLKKLRLTKHEGRNAVDATPKKNDGKTYIAQEQKFRLGDFSYTIGATETQDSIGPRGFRTEASSGAVFVILHYTIENETTRTRTVLSDDFMLRDSKGREFRPASRALTALMMEGGNKDFILSEVQPGIARETVTAFEVPAESTDNPMVLIVPEKGFGAKKVEVLIRP